MSWTTTREDDHVNAKTLGTFLPPPLSQVTRVAGSAKFTGPHSVEVEGKEYHAKHIVIAVGGTPNKLGVPGEDFVIDSDGFFSLETQPKKVVALPSLFSSFVCMLMLLSLSLSLCPHSKCPISPNTDAIR